MKCKLDKYSLRPKILVLDLSKYGCIKSMEGVQNIIVATASSDYVTTKKIEKNLNWKRYMKS